MASDDHADASAGGRRVGIVAHRQRRYLEPVGAMDARVARTERGHRGESAVAADVLLDAVRVIGRPEAEAKAYERTARRQVAAHKLAREMNGGPPGHPARPDPEKHDLGRDD